MTILPPDWTRRRAKGWLERTRLWQWLLRKIPIPPMPKIPGYPPWGQPWGTKDYLAPDDEKH